MDQQPRNPIVHNGARGGLILGLFFLVLFYASVYGVNNYFLSIVGIAAFLSVPFVAYRILRRSYVSGGCRMQFAGVWLEGILMFLFGALILSVGAYIFFRFIDPDYITRMLRVYVDMSEQAGVSDGMTDAARQILEMNYKPKPIDMIMSLIWTVGFSGSILSLILTPIVRLKTWNKNRLDR